MSLYGHISAAKPTNSIQSLEPVYTHKNIFSRLWSKIFSKSNDLLVEASRKQCIEVYNQQRSSITFTIFPANGGFVIQHFKNERLKDNEGQQLTVVNNHDEIGKAIEHIMAIEAIKS